MLIELDGINTLKVTRQKGDQGYYKPWPKSESTFLYHVKKALNENGFDLIKKRMWKDGHLVDEEQQYLRTRGPNSAGPHIYIHNSAWSLYDAGRHFTQDGYVYLTVTPDVYHEQEDCQEMLAERLAGGIEWAA